MVELVVLLPVALLAGLATALSPCILPVLPLVLAGGAGGGRRRPLGIVAGVVLGFAAVTLAASALANALGLPPSALRIAASIAIAVSAVTLLVPALGEWVTVALSRVVPAVSFVDGAGDAAVGDAGEGTAALTRSSGFAGGMVVGLGAGVLWTPCAGPVLAAVSALAATQRLSLPAVLITVVYGIGAAVPLLLVAWGGQGLAGGFRAFRPYALRFRQAFGAVLLAMAAITATGSDAGVQSALAAAGPQGVGEWIDRIERGPLVRRWLGDLFDDTFYGRVAAPSRPPSPAAVQARAGASAVKLDDLGPAPEFQGITAWFNGGPTTLQALRGKVVLVDFWTYSCINCLRTLPYLENWYEQYKDAGLVVVGVHTPEFAFEAEPRNVQAAITREGLRYPVALDPKFATWIAYENRFWPSKYLIDAQGRVRLFHAGEGAYDETEAAIRTLLAEAGMPVPNADAPQPRAQFVSSSATPETYLGYGRLDAAQYASAQPIGKDREQRYSVPGTPALNGVGFDGTWTLHEENAEAGADGQLVLRFTASSVYLVMAPGGAEPARVQVQLDGQAIGADAAGVDVRGSVVTVDTARLYHLVDLRGQQGAHTLRLVFEKGGTQCYAFTFG
jgi:cytochrome c biogenesis protein CcdA/thiol-disulfide isomerase/thioredoxin